MKRMVEVLKDFGIDLLPRAVGVPHQQMITYPKQYIQFIKLNNGKVPLFTSHNSYPSLTKYRNPKVIRLKNLFLDFDLNEGNGFKTVAHDTQLVSDLLLDYDIAHSISFSGNRGYHIYIHFNDTMESVSNGVTLKYRNIYAFLRRSLNLQTLDMQCAEPKRLCRIPCSKYVGKDGVNGSYCYPIPSNMDVPKSEKNMHQMASKLPDGGFMYRRGSRKITIDEFMEELNISSETVEEEDMYDTVKYHIPDNNFLTMIGEFFRPCIRNSLFTRNPPHFVRVSACIKIKAIEYDIPRSIKLFDRISQHAKWVDRTNKQRRDYHISTIYNKQYRMPNCRTLKLKGLCVGEDCKYWKPGLTDEDDNNTNYEVN